MSFSHLFLLSVMAHERLIMDRSRTPEQRMEVVRGKGGGKGRGVREDERGATQYRQWNSSFRSFDCVRPIVLLE